MFIDTYCILPLAVFSQVSHLSGAESTWIRWIRTKLLQF